jgi:hypothetical protein
VVVAALEILAACVLYVRSLFEILETGFSMSARMQPVRTDRPEFGPYSKGTWPFTYVSTVEEHLTGRGGTGYEARVQAAVYDVEKIVTGSHEHIFVSKQVDVQTSSSPNARREYFNRIPSMGIYANTSHPAAWMDKDLPSLPSVFNGTYPTMRDGLGTKEFI